MGGKPSKGTPADMRLKGNQGKPKAQAKPKGRAFTGAAMPFGSGGIRKAMPKGAPVRPLTKPGG